MKSVKSFSFYAAVLTAALCLSGLTARADSFLEGNAPNWLKPWAVSAGLDVSICLGDSTQLQATGANSYTWAPAIGLSCTNCPNPVASPTVTTTYFVTGDDGTMDEVVVKVLVPPVILNIILNDPTDCNLPNGSIAISMVGLGSYEYSIDGGAVWQNSGIFTALPPGNYAIRVRGSNGICEISGGSYTLVAPPAPLNLSVLANDPTFCDVPNGSIVISASGGISPLEYSIDNGQTWLQQNVFQSLTSGNYQIKVRNGNGTCETSGGSFMLTGSPDEAIIADIFTASPTNCNAQDGLITVIVSNDGGQFEFSINGGISYHPNNSFAGLDEGVYHIFVRRTDGTCAKSGGYFTLTSPNRPTIYGVSKVNPLSCGGQNGNITILAFGPSTLQFSVDGGQTWFGSNVFSNLPASTYSVVVRNDDGSCVTAGGTVTLTEPGPPVISHVNATNPSDCGLTNGSIIIVASGVGQLEYSIDNGIAWQQASVFNNLAEGDYQVKVQYVGGGCPVSYGSNPIVLDAPGAPPVISAINTMQPSACGVTDGSISIVASASGPLSYSINGGNSFQTFNVFNSLGAGDYQIVVKLTNGNCSTAGTANLFYSGCTDTIQVTIPWNINTDYCIDPAVFNNLGTITSAVFLDVGNALTVAGANINQNCLTLSPSPGFTGLSPDLICVVHCFNNSTTICDTTYLQVTVEGVVICDDVFSTDSVSISYTGNPTNYCVPVPLTDLLGFELYLNGAPLVSPFACDFEPTTAYSFTFLPGAGFSGPYSLDSWSVNGNSYAGYFNDANELLALMLAFDPNGNWQINLSTGLIYGGDQNANYGDMEVTHIPSGSTTVLNTNTTFLPTGFTVGLADPGVSVLVVQNPVDGCADTLYINAILYPITTDTVYLTTNVNIPTASTCLDGSELPGGLIVNVGYCGGPSNGSAPLTSPECVYYIPNLNFAGQDEFCMVVCDGGFPQVCDTTIFIVNVLPENDTVYLTIPIGETSVDTCLGNFVIELPGSVTSADFIGINTSEITGTLNGNCLTFNSTGTFFGTTTVCVSFCSGGVCDENTFIVTIVPPVICEEIFDQNTLSFATPTPDNFFCIPIPIGEIFNYNVTLDSNPVPQTFTPCGFDFLTVYSYANLPGGPYNVDAWTANGTLHSGPIADINALVAMMNTWDADGNWVLNTTTQTIQGGQGGTYSDLVITPLGGAPQTFTANLVQFPLGSQMAISGYGNHEVIVTAANGCADTVQVEFVQHLVSTDTLVFNTPPNTAVTQICGNTSELIGNLFSISFCGVPSNGGFVPTSATCFTYTPNLGFIGADSACVVFCDDNFPTVCDTFVFIINVQPVPDTVYVDAPGTMPFDTCLNSSVLQLPGILTSSSICGANANEVTLTLTGNCVTIDLEDNFIGSTTACVVHCDDSTPQVCDTTYLVITSNGMPPPCPEIFNPDNILLPLQNGVGEVCLPIAPAQIVDFLVTIDGLPYNGALTPCNMDQVVIYFFGQVSGQGANGPYSVSWQANGQNFSSVVQNMQELVNQLNTWDPAGNWIIEPQTYSLISTNINGVYGNLIITHIATGILSTIAPNFNSVPFGTAVQISGAGPHEIIVENQVDGCSDTLTINALNGVGQLDIFTLEDVPSNVSCIDTMGLPGNFQSMTVCETPQNGTISIVGNCFTYNPAPGFVGTNTGCMVVCDNLGNCDTTLLNITVAPLCSMFDIFPDTTAQIQVIDCADIAAYCTPILLDSIGNYGVLDNGFPYAGNFVVCNGQFAQIALDTGFHEVIFVQMNTGCQDTLYANVSCSSNDGCGISALSPLTIDVDDCAATTQFCVSVSVLDLPNFLITDNGAAFGGTIGICDLNGTTVGMTLDTGMHMLILADTVKGCADTFLVNVLCTIIEDVTVDTTVAEGDSLVLCLGDFGYQAALIDSVTSVCTGNGNTSFSIDPTIWCITFYGDAVGLDTACFLVSVGDTSAIFTVNIEVTTPCPVFIPGGILATGVPCSVDTGLICLPISFLELANKTLQLGGLPYTGPLLPCSFDSTLILNYNSLPTMGLLGPYIVQSWSINGIPFTGVFNTIQELADLMNTWDPTGNWVVILDPINSINVIQGGNPTNVYSAMSVEQQLTSVVVSLGINTITVPTGVAIEVPLGGYLLTITDTVTLCSETAIVELVCITSDVVVDTILVGTQDTFCLNLSDLVGSVASATNICPGSNGQTVTFTIDSSFCVIYQGNAPGFDSACVVVCDDAGLCDTTYFFITVNVTNDSLPIAVNDTGNLTSQGDPTVIQVLANDTVQFLLTVSIVDQPANGAAQVLPNGSINYVPNQDYCNEAVPDSFTYAICNPFGCDTATVHVTVLCSELEIFEAFSPNGDGKNETFKINGLQDWPNHHLRVYSRWGTLVYEATNYVSDWEGTWKDKNLPDGTYFYILELGDGGGTKRGYVVILR
ncbi:MAG: gliding motility-associated C-terminal domain-containing protein [Bacteroidales bacterium]|nr:gliding motility-associated C-terminal domain-containing protein [Bacteroidales bacterium]